MTKLVDSSGNVKLGIFPTPVQEVNYRDFDLTNPAGRRLGRLRRYFAFKQFQFLGVLSEQLVFGCAIADLRYIGTAFVYLYEPATRKLREHSFRSLLATGAQFDQLPETGTSRYQSGANSIEMTGSQDPRERRLKMQLAQGLAIDAVFSEDRPPIEPMIICTRAGATGWVFARKTAGLHVSGTVEFDGEVRDLEDIEGCGHHDWSAGFMRRRTFWNWGCLAGRTAQGAVVGMNVSCGVNETSFTENCFWVNGKLHKIDCVDFQYDRHDLGKPWRLASYDGRLKLEFRPEGRHLEKVNALLLASNFSQLFGRYYGRLETAAGDRIRIDGMVGYAESHYAKW